MLKSFMMIVLLTSVAPTLVYAQQARPNASRSPEVTAEDDSEIVVTAGARQRGAVLGDIKPELQLSPADIRSFGVSSMAELLSALSPQTTSGRGGSPVTLLNGKRISGFNEIRDLPPEAIARVDILPEAVALKYGFTADQKVVNIVLRQRFKAYSAEMNYGFATDGGAQLIQPEATYLRIRKNGRLNIELEYPFKTALLESERNVISGAPSKPYALAGNVVDATGTVFGVLPSAATHAPTSTDFSTTVNSTSLQPFRTLQPESKNLTVNAVYSRSSLGAASVTLNARLDLVNTTANSGLPTLSLVLPNGNPFAPFGNQPVTLYRYINAAGPLTQHVTGATEHLGLAINNDINRDWHWSFTANYDHAESRTVSQTGFAASAVAGLLAANPTLNPYGPISTGVLPLAPANQAHSITNTGVVDMLINGKLFAMPAGDVTGSAKIAAQDSVFDSDTQRFGVAQNSHLVQTIASGQISFDVPIASRKENVLAVLGDLSLNGNAVAKHFSGFGTLKRWGYGLNWTPLKPLSLNASFSNDQSAPTVGQLSNPVITTPNALVFNPLTGATALVTQISGGNPALKASDNHVMTLEANLKPLSKTDLTLNATYTRRATNNLISSPTLLQSFQAATIDPLTQQVTINTSPTNFARAEREQFRWGVNFSKLLKSKQPAAGQFGRGGADRADSARPGGAQSGGNRGAGGAGAGRGPGGGFGGAQGGRLQVAVYHTLYLHDTVQTVSGAVPLNLLNGDTSGANGGQPRHQIELQAGYFNNGLGARLSADWQSATTVNGLTPAGTLHFGPQTTTSFRLFANLGAMPNLTKDHPFLRGVRLMLVVNNILNTRQSVVDGTGAPSISYQPAYLDPAGRTIRISIRKLFF